MTSLSTTSTSSSEADQEPLPSWCGPLLMTLKREYPEHSTATVADAIRQALALQQEYRMATPVTHLASRFLGGEGSPRRPMPSNRH
ncbi:hypothetical protein [Luteolibacter soli]|uniref:Uncharacterized protein n=1 Tax=Luteolibacter soli TaxID=3135280 RepID=A0ABU9AVI3_9BACT